MSMTRSVCGFVGLLVAWPLSLLPFSVEASRVAVAVPDLAGMLYQTVGTHRIETFGTDEAFAGLLKASEFDTLRQCKSTLCLDVAWSSVFASDPFVLRSFESQYEVHSETFDAIATEFRTAITRPVITGNSTALGSPVGSNTSDMTTATRWRFHTDLQSMRLTFRLNQQSQRHAITDQLIVHVAATRREDNTGKFATNTHVVYGNARLEHWPVSQANNHGQVNIAIMRDDSSPEVTTRDAYPLRRPLATDQDRVMWTMPDAGCRQHTAELLGCKSETEVNTGSCSFDQSSAPFVRCLRDTRAMRPSWFRELAMKSSVVQTISIRNSTAACMDALILQDINSTKPVVDASWWSVVRVLSYLAHQQCPFGPKNGVVASDLNKFVRIESGTSDALYMLQLHDTTEFSGHISLEFESTGEAVVLSTDTLTDVSSAGEIETLIQSLVASLVTPRVSVSKEFDDASTAWTINVTISDLVFPNLALTFESSDGTKTAFASTPSLGGPVVRVVALSNYEGVSSEDPCSTCSAELLPCAMASSCRQHLLPCVVDVLDRVSTKNATIDEVYGLYRIDLLSEIHRRCVANSTPGDWVLISRVMRCFGRHTCDLSGKNTTNAYETTAFRFIDGSQRILIPRYTDENNRSRVVLTVAFMGKTHEFNQSLDTLKPFLQSVVLPSDFPVDIEINDSAMYEDMIQLQLSYANSLLPNPCFNGTTGVEIIEDIAPVVLLEFGDRSTFSVAQLLNNVRQLLLPQIANPIVNTNWKLAEACEKCSAELFGCSSMAVRNHSCNYDNAPSSFAKCIRKHVPRQAFIDLLAASNPVPSLRVSSFISECMKTNIRTGDTSGAQLVLRALAAFASTGCPFGPLDLVQEGIMVSLSTSDFLHTLRMDRTDFKIHFLLSIHSTVIAEFTVTAPSFVDEINQALSPLGIDVRYSSTNYSRAQRLSITFRYSGIATPDLAITVQPHSSPPDYLLEQSFIPSSAWVRVTKRVPILVYRLDGEYANSTQSGSGSSLNGNGSWGSSQRGSWGSGSSGGATNMPVRLRLSKADGCAQCDAIHLSNCGGSTYCYDLMKTCLLAELNVHNFSELAMKTTNTTTEIDLAYVLHFCIREQRQESLVDWWDPLQRWLTCYAAYSCSMADANAAGSGGNGDLIFVPASVQITTATAGVDDVASALTITAQTGSSAMGQEFKVKSLQELERLLAYLTQWTSTVSSTFTGGVLTLKYSEPFLGTLPLIIESPPIVHSLRDTSPQLLYRSRADVPNPGWEIMSAKLSAVLPTYTTCAMCAETYLSLCRIIPDCGQYTLECVQYSIVNNTTPGFGQVFDLNDVIANCSKGLPLESFEPLVNYITCVRDAQCKTSAESESAISFLRVVPGQIRFLMPDPTTRTAATISAPGSKPADASQSRFLTVPEIRTQLQMVSGKNTNVEIKIEGDLMPEIVFEFHNYVGTMPRLRMHDVEVKSRSPAVIVYSTEDLKASVSLLVSTIKPYIVEQTCDNICTEHLNACIHGTTVDSMLCRYQALPALKAALVDNYGGLLDQGWHANVERFSISVSSLIRTISGATLTRSYLAAAPLINYVVCIAKSKCPLHRPSSEYVRTILSVQWGQQAFDIPQGGGYSPSLPEQTANTIFYATSPELVSLQMQYNVMGGLASVKASSLTIPDSHLIRIELTYYDYIGALPIIRPNEGEVKTTTEPSLSIEANGSSPNWPRLHEPIMSYYNEGRARNCSSCTQMQNLTSTQALFAACAAKQAQYGGNQGSSYISLQECVIKYPSTSDFAPVINYFKCLVSNACDLAMGDSLRVEESTVLEIYPGYLDTNVPLSGGYVLIWPPPPLTDATTKEPIYIFVTRENNFFSLTDALKKLLTQDGQTPVISVDVGRVDENNSMNLRIRIADYVGWLPSILHPNQFGAFITLGLYRADQLWFPRTLWHELSSSITRMISPSSQLVLSGQCAECAALLFGCDVGRIATGLCSYQSRSTGFMNCISSLDQLFTSGASSRQHVSNQIWSCVSQVAESGETTSSTMWRQDQWYQAYKGLQCFTVNQCAFGPTTQIISDGAMHVLEATTTTKTMTALIPSVNFTSVLHATVGARVYESAEFNETTTESELQLIVGSVLPETASFSVSATHSNDSYSLQITWADAFLPPMFLVLDAGAYGEFPLLSDGGSPTYLATTSTVDLKYLAKATTV